MYIQQLAQETGVARQTIRFYESIGLLPAPQRAANNYRDYGPEAADRLRFIASARSLGFSLDDIREFVVAREAHTLPCSRVVDSLDERIAALDRRIADLLTLRANLMQIRNVGQALPPDKFCDDQCACYLLTLDAENGRVLIQPEESHHD
jgi:DNA-binding transcriptional MerR regulator